MRPIKHTTTLNIGLGDIADKATGGALSSITGAIGDVAGSLGAAGLDFASAKHLQNDQQSFNKKMYKNRFQYSMEDMKKAGLNPILAARMGLGGTGSASSGIANASGGPGTTAVQTARAIAEIKRINAETALTNRKTQVIGPAGELGDVLTFGIEPWAKGAKEALTPQGRERLSSSAKDLIRRFKATSRMHGWSKQQSILEAKNFQSLTTEQKREYLRKRRN